VSKKPFDPNDVRSIRDLDPLFQVSKPDDYGLEDMDLPEFRDDKTPADDFDFNDLDSVFTTMRTTSEFVDGIDTSAILIAEDNIENENLDPDPEDFDENVSENTESYIEENQVSSDSTVTDDILGTVSEDLISSVETISDEDTDKPVIEKQPITKINQQFLSSLFKFKKEIAHVESTESDIESNDAE